MAGCAGGTKSSNSAGSGGPALTVDQAVAAVAKAMAPQAYSGPRTSPTVPANKTIASVVCSNTAQGCVVINEGLIAAAKLIGWKVKSFDGKGSPSDQNAAILQAVAQKVDGIILDVIDSSQVRQGVAAAHKAGIPLVSMVGGSPVGTQTPTVFQDIGVSDKFGGESLANFIVAQSGGKAKVALFYAPEFVASERRYEGAVSVLSRCAGCDVVSTTKYTAATALTNTALSVKSVLQAHPDIDWVFFDIGQYAAVGVQAINQMGRGKAVKLVSYDCLPQNFSDIKKGNVQQACAGVPISPVGWAGLNEMIRAIAKEQPAPDDIPVRLFDKSNVPASGSYDGDFDVETTYKKLWNVR
jgi:ribose transport system substrate-binding protein